MTPIEALEEVELYLSKGSKTVIVAAELTRLMAQGYRAALAEIEARDATLDSQMGEAYNRGCEHSRAEADRLAGLLKIWNSMSLYCPFCLSDGLTHADHCTTFTPDGEVKHAL